VVDAAAVARELGAAVEAFGAPPAAAPAPRWGSLFDALDPAGDDEYVTAVELIYEGYLCHYRESRAAAIDAGDRAAALLAGDFLYARGLRLVAARGDAEAVGLLARLMAACSHLRSVGAPFAADDALWAYTMGGLAALRAGSPGAEAAALFDRLDETAVAGGPLDVPAAARAAAPRLGLRDAAPLEAALHAAATTDTGG
jgi:hypothetical protein